MRLTNQIAIVTGAGRNIGEATTKLFASEGAKVAVVDTHEGRGGRVVKDLEREGHEALLVLCDISKSDQVKEMVNKVVGRFGAIDILVNNAAITDHKDILNITEEEFDQVISVTLKGTFLVGKYVAEQMVRQGRGGKIINIASTSGLTGRADAIAYSAAKGGVVNLTRSMAVQLAPHKIRVNSVTPNRSGSPVGEDEGAEGREFKNLAGRLGTPEDQAGAILFLASDDAGFIYGHNLLVDGGITAGSIPFTGRNN
jgi:NAD(P)-dependent dehydrogenase (short-subunit alcohol dehydrogenase family)